MTDEKIQQKRDPEQDILQENAEQAIGTTDDAAADDKSSISDKDKSSKPRKKSKKLMTRFFKRFFDILSSGLGIIILSPFFLLFTPIVAIAMKGNPFFTQKRPGKNGKIFKMIKYRTMTNAKDKEGNLLPDEQRLTKFGKLMRSLSIDELPELFNIFAGQMSVVGPRPLLVQYLPLYNEFQARRHEVRPGLTGLAQVSGRNAISWDEKFKKDVEYVDNYSIGLDIKILFMTVVKVFKRDGISQEGQATMEFFTGNDDKSQEQDPADSRVVDAKENSQEVSQIEDDTVKEKDNTDKDVKDAQ